MAISIQREDNELIIRVPLENPARSKSGKTLLVASTHGLVTTELVYQGRHVVLLLNAFIYPNEQEVQGRARASMSRVAGKLK